MSATTVITPYSWGSRAVELGNRQWRKRILPVGDVEYQGRTLHFTREYLASLEQAFRDRAYDQVSFQLAKDKNEHTNDPERHRGTITNMMVDANGPDGPGLYVLLDPTEAGERVLKENPYLGVSARIVENYPRSDGKFYPYAIQHVLGTLDPRIPGLGAWQPVDMANGGEMIIDLSQWSWAGEPGPSYEMAVSAVASRLPAAPQADPYDTGFEAILAASLPGGYGYGGVPVELANDFDRAFELANTTELARLAEDTVPLPRRAEDRVAHLVGRAARGTYTPAGYAAYSLAAQGGTTGMATCGTADDLGYCRERFHAPGCGSAATPDITEALRPQLADIALRPHIGADGQVTFDRRFGSPMTLTDHIEAATGQRLGDASLWESHRGQRRELAAPLRTSPYPAVTVATATALAAQAGISTPADTAVQRAAAVREHDRQAARLRGPRHADYTEHASPARRAVELAQFGDEPLHGSLPVYTGAR